jgi:hypothetical protein
MTNPITDPNAWEPVDAPIKSDIGIRDASTNANRAGKYRDVVRQFDVANNPRYVRGHANPGVGRETYCNIFLCDVMLAMGLGTPPHWQDPATGAPVAMGKGKETDANGVCNWMSGHALAYDWMECSEIQARKRATEGYPTCVVWLNPGGIGHVAVVLPGVDCTHIAQSGGTNFFDDNIKKGFGGITNFRFYTHD